MHVWSGNVRSVCVSSVVKYPVWAPSLRTEEAVGMGCLPFEVGV